MAPAWTSEQKKVIDLHNRNILVAAAAGSGKTAVLVERIIEMISNKDKPCDVDRLVIVTFTHAAAGEMRQRILDAIESRMEAEPENIHLRRQATLINNAQITTIDSFCLNIIRNFFNEADIDPGFSVADSGELELMKADILDEVIEEYYDEGSQIFYDFVDRFAPEKTDVKIADYILKLYTISQSNPWPKDWLMSCKKTYECETVEEFMNTEVMKFLSGEFKKQVESVISTIEYSLKLCEDIDGPAQLMAMLNDDLIFLNALCQAKDVLEGCRLIKDHKYGRRPTVKDENVNQWKIKYIVKARDEYKKVLTKLAGNYGDTDVNSAFNLVCKCRNDMEVYVGLTLKFMDRFAMEKKKKNIIDFNDMEHIALNMLVEKVDGNYVYTKVADELSKRYEEILIDEYQDSNLVQEIILNSISKERQGKPNVFMVGDVKQSIYRFRLARPELFIEKYNSYSEEDSAYQKIELHNNFRSRKEVLYSANDVFEKIMKKDFGNIEYDQNARLYPKAQFPEQEGEDLQSLYKTELHILDMEEIDEMDNEEAEAVLCGRRILELINNPSMKCYDGSLKEYRRINYSDIVILMRSVKSMATVFTNTLATMGIPVQAESGTGYFDTIEISTLVSLLNIIDNPMQDMPLAVVLKSYFGRFTSSELAKIRSECEKNVSFYEAFMASKSEKKETFLSKLFEFREMAKYMSIHELVWRLSYDTGYYDYLATMPCGGERQANVDMLMEKAKSYENTSFHGLFNFLRYIEKLKNYKVEYGQASLIGENDNTVRIMTIHKSKGLEFPIVFLAGAAKNFNAADEKYKIIIDSDLLIGTDYMDLNTRVRHKTIVKKGIAEKIRLANLSEEQRVLYVAMTRAKEKLIITGTVKGAEKLLEGYEAQGEISGPVNYASVTSQRNYLKMILPAVYGGDNFKLSVVKKEAFEKLLDFEERKAVSEEEKGCFVLAEEFVYPHRVIDLPAKMSVSELKFMGQHEDEENSYQLVEEEFENTIPSFIRKDEEVRGSQRGSAYHKIMEIIDYSSCKNVEMIKKYIEDAVNDNRISKEWAQAVNAYDIMKFFNSQIGQQAISANENNKLYRERQFVMGVPAKDIDPNYDTEELILVQGIIDLYMETEDGIILSDYKTDNVPFGEEGRKRLVDRYRKQLDYYQMALEKLTRKKVIKKSIYSFKLGEEIVFS